LLLQSFKWAIAGAKKGNVLMKYGENMGILMKSVVKNMAAHSSFASSNFYYLFRFIWTSKEIEPAD